MNKQMIIAGLKARPVRTSVSILAVTLEVVLILVVVGLTTGIAGGSAKRTAGVGAEITVQPPNSSMFLALANNTMPLSLADEIRKLPAVQAVAPVQVLMNTEDGIEIVYGIDPKSFDAVTGGFSWHQGAMFQASKDIVVDDLWARSKDAKVGDTVELLNQKFKVAGIVEHGKGARLFVPLATLQDLSGSHDKASIFFVKLTRTDHTGAVMDQMHKIFPGYEVRPLKDFLSLMTSANLPGLNSFIDSMIVLAVSIGFLVILLSMYTTVIERTKDIGILKSIGASKGYIIRALLGESALISVLGILAGIGMSYATRTLLLSSFPTLSILITLNWVLRAATIAVIGALLGASYPAWMASRKDAIEALAYD
jgi:putative ABC transport system permease protein